ncbi:MAG: DUF2065 family protein [Gammaproteobacteria bacterium]|jgi:uncharacterized protein YjeT (DUF2065 family)|nr:DUF2065 family protein [Gammaproteobacteria bacterium]
MWERLGDALALLLVIEGVLPFLNPAGMRRTLATVAQLDDRSLRVAGLTSMLAGVLLSYLLH